MGSGKRQTDAATHGVQHAVVQLDALTPHPRNYRRHPEQQVARLGASLARFGQVRSIVVQEGADGRYLLVAGHGLAEAARAHGYHELRADVIPATWTPQQVEGYLIADNETTRGADDDLAQLAAMLEEQQSAGLGLDALGYSDEELAALLEQLADEALAGGKRDVDDPDGGGDDFDTTPDESGPTRVQSGDLWQLGAHRLLCGDSTKREDVARLMDGETAQAVVTDPPYAILGGGTSVAGKGIETAFDRQFFRVWFRSILDMLTPHLTHGASMWFTIDWRGTVAAEEACIGSGWRVAAVGVWNRGGLGMGYALRKTYENFMLLVRDKWKRTSTTEPDVWEQMWTPGHRKEGHAAEKPVPLMVRAVELCGGQSVLDPFLGSGTTLIACERTGRRCYGIELDPRYCDVILRRWEAETGREAVRIEEGAHDASA